MSYFIIYIENINIINRYKYMVVKGTKENYELIEEYNSENTAAYRCKVLNKRK